MSVAHLLRPLSEAEIEAALEAPALAKWGYDGKALVREYQTGSWRATLMIVNAIGHVCEAAWHHPDLQVSFNKVTVRLSTHDVNGVSMRDVECAEQIEAFVCWRPNAHASTLEGVPNHDERYTYLKA